MKKMKILLTRRLPSLSHARLARKCADASIELVQWNNTAPIPRAVLLDMIRGVDGVLLLITERVDEELLNAAGPQLKVISTLSVGYDHINLVNFFKNILNALKDLYSP